jgi:hypothetical protein
MVLETHDEEFHVAFPRTGEEKLGLKVSVADNMMRIDAITGSQIKEMHLPHGANLRPAVVEK